jgi:hypothetical protein
MTWYSSSKNDKKSSRYPKKLILKPEVGCNVMTLSLPAALISLGSTTEGNAYLFFQAHKKPYQLH